MTHGVRAGSADATGETVDDLDAVPRRLATLVQLDRENQVSPASLEMGGGTVGERDPQDTEGVELLAAVELYSELRGPIRARLRQSLPNDK